MVAAAFVTLFPIPPLYPILHFALGYLTQNCLKLTFLVILRAIIIAVTISMTLVIVISRQLIAVTYNGIRIITNSGSIA